MIQERDNLIGRINELVGEESNDNVLSIIEDLTDTLNDYENRVSDSTDWKQKYEENDSEWREKYRARFFSNDEPDDNKDDVNGDDKKPLRYEDLFN